MVRRATMLMVCGLAVARPAAAGDQWSNPYNGISHLYRTTSAPHRIHVIKADLRARNLQVRATRHADRGRTTSSFASLYGCEIAVNGDFFNYTTPYSYFALGLALSGHERWPQNGDSGYEGFIATGFNNQALLTAPADVYDPPPDWMSEAVSGQPLIVDGGVALPTADCGPHFCTLQPRSAVGLSQDGATLILATVDGRSFSSVGMTTFQLGQLMAEMGAWRALNLDGGGSTTMFIANQGGVVNQPSDGSERAVANHIGIDVNPPDSDGDGWPRNFDCNDAGGGIHPGATEACNGVDDNCNGQVDEGAKNRCGGCGPEPAEICDGQDNNCDGQVDEGLVRACGTAVGECKVGQEVCRSGQWTGCTAIRPTPESCDELDNDCDGVVDSGEVCALEAVLGGAAGDAASTTDIDGDGRADVCGRAAAGIHCQLSAGLGFAADLVGPDLADRLGWNQPARYGSIRFGDLDGDGRADLCAWAPAGLRCWLSLGRGFGSEVVGPATAAMEEITRSGSLPPLSFATTLRLADVDGDHRDDLCLRLTDGFRCWPTRVASGARPGVDFASPLWFPALSDDAGWGEPARYGSLRMGDVDGDGRADLCGRDEAELKCWFSTGRGFSLGALGPAWSDAAGWSTVDRWSTIRLVDIDSDGRSDLCARTAADFRCHLATEQGFGDALVVAPLPDAEGWTSPSRYATIRMADVDGDRHADLCARASDGVACWLWSGEGWNRRVFGPELSDAAGWRAARYYHSIRMADVNGDGRADLCARGKDGLSCWISRGGDFPTEMIGPSWQDVAWARPEYYTTIAVAGGHAPVVLASGCGIGGSASHRSLGPVIMLLALWIGCLRRRASRS